jgi:hypothetical protein
MRVFTSGELVELLDRFGMKVQLDPAGAAADGVSPELVTARLAHALVGVVEAHASQAEDAARRTGAEVEDLAEVALMAFAGASCQGETDEWALIQWRAVRLSMVLSELDFGGPFPREGRVGSGDVLVRTIRQVAAALSGMATAKHAAVNPLRPAGESRDAAAALAKAMTVLEQAAADAPLHRNLAQLMTMTD